MSGRWQRERFIRAHRDPSVLPEDRFEYATEHGKKIRCVMCHRDGYGSPTPLRNYVTFDGRKVRWSDNISLWQIDCLADHPWPCSCGLAFTRFRDLWAHIGAPRPVGWGRQSEHRYALECELEVS